MTLQVVQYELMALTCVTLRVIHCMTPLALLLRIRISFMNQLVTTFVMQNPTQHRRTLRLHVWQHVSTTQSIHCQMDTQLWWANAGIACRVEKNNA